MGRHSFQSLADACGWSSEAVVCRAMPDLKNAVDLPESDQGEGVLTINEIYESIQGESSWAGERCVFVRLTFCYLLF